MTPALHVLKCVHPSFFRLVGGEKTYEIRREGDRHFRVGDFLWLRETEAMVDARFREVPYTGRAVLCLVIHKTEPGEWGLPTDVCVLGIKLLHYQGKEAGALPFELAAPRMKGGWADG